MSDLNPDHLKYMPHSPQESEAVSEVPQEGAPAEKPAEEVVVEEAAVVVEEVQPDVLAPEGEGSGSPEGSPEVDFPKSASDNVLFGFIYNLFGPLVVPTIAALFIFLLSLLSVVAPAASLPYSLTVFGATCLLPAIILYILLRTGFISSFQLYDRTERIIPYVVEFLVLGAMAIFFVCKGAAPWIWTVFAAGAAIALVNMIINFKIRISNHCSAVAALLAVLIIIQTYGVPPQSLFWWVAGCALVSGIVGSLAVIRGRHSLWEVMAGYVTGFLGVILFSLIR